MTPKARKTAIPDHAGDYAIAYKAARKILPPRPGVLVQFRSIESGCLYVQMHALDVRGWRGDVVVANMPKADGEEVAHDG